MIEIGIIVSGLSLLVSLVILYYIYSNVLPFINLKNLSVSEQQRQEYEDEEEYDEEQEGEEEDSYEDQYEDQYEGVAPTA